MNPDLPKGNALSKRLSKKTVVFITLAILVSLSASVYILFFTGSAPKINQLFKPKAPTVTVKTETKNPFKKETCKSLFKLKIIFGINFLDAFFPCNPKYFKSKPKEKELK